MTAPANATAVDTATGQIESERVSIDANTSNLNGSRQVFRRRYSQYIDSSSNEGESTERLLFFGPTTGTPVREFSDGSSSIPYQNLGIAMTPTQYALFTAHCNQVKVHGLGYEIKKITILQENLTTRAQGTILENTFQSRPSVLVFPDRTHMLDEVVGVKGLTAAGSGTGSNTGNPRLMRSLLGLPTLATAMNNDASIGTLSFIYPGSQADGGMPEVSWYMTNGEANLRDARWYLDDIINPVVLGEGEKHRFEWKNPNPQWHKSGIQPWKGMCNSNAATPSPFTPGGYWPSSRESALGFYYKGSSFDQVADNAYDSTGTNATQARRAGLPTKGQDHWTGDTVPPYHYIKLPPLFGPTSKMNFTVELWIEYFIDLEWRTTGLLPFCNNPVWPSNTSITNATASSTIGLSALRNTFGAAQGASLIGFVAEAEEDERSTRRRHRFEDLPNSMDIDAQRGSKRSRDDDLSNTVPDIDNNDL